MATKIAYPARFERDDGGFILVTFRDLPEAGTNARSDEEASSQAVDCLNSVLMFRMKYREAMPAPSKARKGEIAIAPDPDVAIKAALYRAVQESGMSIADLARALDVDYREVQRIMNPNHPTKLRRMNEALRAAGKKVIIEVATA